MDTGPVISGPYWRGREMTGPARGMAVDVAALRGFATRADGLGGEISGVRDGLADAAALPGGAFGQVAEETALPGLFAETVRARLAAIDAAGRGLAALGEAVRGAADSYEQGEADRADIINRAARTH